MHCSIVNENELFLLVFPRMEYIRSSIQAVFKCSLLLDLDFMAFEVPVLLRHGFLSLSPLSLSRGRIYFLLVVVVISSHL